MQWGNEAMGQINWAIWLNGPGIIAPAPLPHGPVANCLINQRSQRKSVRVPLTFCVLSVLKNPGSRRSMSSKYEDKGGVLFVAL